MLALSCSLVDSLRTCLLCANYFTGKRGFIHCGFGALGLGGAARRICSEYREYLHKNHRRRPPKPNDHGPRGINPRFLSFICARTLAWRFMIYKGETCGCRFKLDFFATRQPARVAPQSAIPADDKNASTRQSPRPPCSGASLSNHGRCHSGPRSSPRRCDPLGLS